MAGFRTHMTRLRRAPPLLPGLVLFRSLPAAWAHSGALDGNGCHYGTSDGRYHCHRQVKPNPDANAPVKKSPQNICHEVRSPNYRTVRYFISYPSMPACVTSGGRVPG
jgi:hypothetical protein